MGSFAAENIDRGQMDLQARCATRGNWNANGGQFGVQYKDKTRTNKKIEAKDIENKDCMKVLIFNFLLDINPFFNFQIGIWGL